MNGLKVEFLGLFEKRRKARVFYRSFIEYARENRGFHNEVVDC